MGENIRILILSDVSRDVAAVKFELRQAGIGFSCERVTNNGELQESLGRSCPDVILAICEEMSFHVFMSLTSARKLCPDTAFILISDEICETKIAEYQRDGVTEWVSKGRLSLLGAAVRRSLRAGESPAERPATESARRILVAEDSPVNRKLALHILETLGYLAEAVDNGLEVIRALEAASYDLILMDVHMPEMGGLEATKAIREKERITGVHIPILAFTASAEEADNEKYLDAGMDGSVAKSVEMNALATAIDDIIAKFESTAATDCK